MNSNVNGFFIEWQLEITIDVLKTERVGINAPPPLPQPSLYSKLLSIDHLIVELLFTNNTIPCTTKKEVCVVRVRVNNIICYMNGMSFKHNSYFGFYCIFIIILYWYERQWSTINKNKIANKVTSFLNSAKYAKYIQ